MRYLTVLCGAVLLSACAAGPTQVDELPTSRSIRGPAALEQALRDAGLVVERQQLSTDESGAAVHRWQVEGEPLLIMEGDFSRFVAAGDVLTDMVGSGALIWSTPEMSVAYAGSNGGVRLVLDALLGDPRDQVVPDQDEPYPPAVLAALRQVAETYERGPGELEVLRFEERVWPDGCLGLTREPGSNACTLAEESGWLIDIRLEGAIIRVRSNTLGSVIKLESPAE